MEWVVIGLTLVLVISILLHPYTFKKGIQKGMDDFLSMLLENGFTFKINAFSKQNKFVKSGGIVFVGDSITQDYNVYEYFSDLHVYNRGIGGDTTVGLKTRLDVSVFDLKPKTVILMIGTNDLALLKTTPETVAQNIKEIIETIKNQLPDTKIILQSIYPVNETMSPMTVLPRKNADIIKINQILAQLQKVIYVDVYSHLLKDGKLNPAYSVEGLHLNEQGYEVITNLLKIHLK